mgnify:CR=1 FL=1
MEKIINVLTYHPMADGKTKDTEAIQQAIDAGAKQKLPVKFPEGVYLVGSLFLRENSHLIFEEGAVLKGSLDIYDYPEIPTRIAGIELSWPAAIVNIIETKNVKIEGPGCIDGQGEYWWNLYWGKDQKSGQRAIYDQQGLRWLADYLVKRPRNCLVYQAENITINDLYLERSGFWNLQVTYSRNVHLENLTIQNNHGPSTDGIDIDSSTDIRITGCSFDCGDDCISIKSGRDGDGRRVNKPSEKIEIDHCKVLGGYGVTIGSEVSGGVRDVFIHDIEFDHADCGIRMKSSKERGGFIENIDVENLRMTNVQFPFSWIMDWHNEYNRKKVTATDKIPHPEIWHAVAEEIPEELQMTKVRNIHIKNVRATLEKNDQKSSRAFDLVAFPNKPMENILFEDCQIEAAEFGRIAAVEKLVLKNVEIKVAQTNNQSNDTFDNR